ncbi:ABC-2 type transport system ATP-binding protein [Enterococcus sp. AZ194]|uniref:ABC transporter ATP-binding protein n=1 Tax=Enterococcus sp. AZ194 TaxID=2774629 RepID=UPI003F1E9DB8
MFALEIQGVKKSFKQQEVLKGVNLQVQEGSIYGFVGENGAGKTTTMKMIVGLAPIQEGCIQVFGMPVQFGHATTNKLIGYLPDVPEFYSYMTSREYLILCGELTGMRKQDIKKRSEELLTLVNLADEKKKIGGFSRGMKQRLGIAQALLNRPRLLICDEPTSALDPMGRKEILDILLSLKGQTTVLFSTHILSDVERICDSIGILHNGVLQTSGSIEELKKVYGQEGISVTFETEEEMKRLLTKLTQLMPTITSEKNGTVVFLTSEHSLDELGQQLMTLLLDEQIVPLEFKQSASTLESIFLEVVK